MTRGEDPLEYLAQLRKLFVRLDRRKIDLAGVGLYLLQSLRVWTVQPIADLSRLLRRASQIVDEGRGQNLPQNDIALGPIVVE
jgi:hypothetical protein